MAFNAMKYDIGENSGRLAYVQGWKDADALVEHKETPAYVIIGSRSEAFHELQAFLRVRAAMRVQGAADDQKMYDHLRLTVEYDEHKSWAIKFEERVVPHAPFVFFIPGE